MAQVLHLHLSESFRIQCSRFIFMVSLICILLALSLLGFNIYVFFYFASKAQLLSESLSFGTYSVSNILVSALIVCQQSFLCFIIYYTRRSRNRILVTKRGLLNLMVYSFILSIVIILPSILWYSHWFVQQIANGFVAKMKDKLQLFPKHIEERVNFNKLQFDYNCCGANDWKDWNEVNGFRSDKSNNYQTNVPFSCCKTDYNGFCYNKDLKRNNNKKSINTKGCAKVFYDFIVERIYYAITFWAIILGIQLLTFLLFQYCKSSIQSAVQSGNPKSGAEGWLWLPFVGKYKKIIKDIRNTTTKRSRKSDKTLRTPSDPFVDLREPPVWPVNDKWPNSPSLSPRYQLMAPELSRKMTRQCNHCNRLTFPTGTHVCISKQHSHSTTFMAFSDDDFTRAEESDSSEDGKHSEYQKNYRNDPSVNKSFERSRSQSKDPLKQSSNIDPKKVTDRRVAALTTSDDDHSVTKLDAIKRKYRERYFILKEIR